MWHAIYSRRRWTSLRRTVAVITVWAVRHRIQFVSVLSYSNTTVYYGIHERSECIAVDSGVTNLIHDCRVFHAWSRGECGSMCPLKLEQARRETQQWVMRRLLTADSIVGIGRKSRSGIKPSSHRAISSHWTGEGLLSSSDEMGMGWDEWCERCFIPMRNHTGEQVHDPAPVCGFFTTTNMSKPSIV